MRSLNAPSVTAAPAGTPAAAISPAGVAFGLAALALKVYQNLAAAKGASIGETLDLKFVSTFGA
jgi:hypothetical protein